MLLPQAFTSWTLGVMDFAQGSFDGPLSRERSEILAFLSGLTDVQGT